MENLLLRAQALEEQIIRDRRHLHRTPEFGLDLPLTSAYVKERLSEMGVSWRDCGGAVPAELREKYLQIGYPEMNRITGIVATIGEGGPCIMLRADMDALPVREETGLPFAFDGNAGHMCGHDAHAAMLLGAAALLKEHEGELCGTVKFMFQVGEELGSGAKLMIADGLLTDPEVDAAIAIHLMPDREKGKLFYASGTASSSMDTYALQIIGKGGHSSQPQLTVDPINILNQLHGAVNLLIGREADPRSTVTLSTGVVKSGSAANIIPESAELHFSMRTYDDAARTHLTQRIPEMVEHYVKAWRGTYRMEIISTPSIVNDSTLIESLLPHCVAILGEENLVGNAPLSATEDFSYISAQVPSMFFMLGAGGPGAYPLHSAKMTLDESAFARGAAVYAGCALGWLRNRA